MLSRNCDHKTQIYGFNRNDDFFCHKRNKIQVVVRNIYSVFPLGPYYKKVGDFQSTELLLDKGENTCCLYYEKYEHWANVDTWANTLSAWIYTDTYTRY